MTSEGSQLCLVTRLLLLWQLTIKMLRRQYVSIHTAAARIATRIAGRITGRGADLLPGPIVFWLLRFCFLFLLATLFRRHSFPYNFALSQFAKSAECTASRYTELVIVSYRSLYGANRQSRRSCAQRVRRRSMIDCSMSLHHCNVKVALEAKL